MRVCAAVFVFMLLVCFNGAKAQTFGGNPSSVKWRQVNTPYTKVIYPRGLDSVASRVATITSLVMQQDAGSLGNVHRKINLVLQANNTLSNAYVQLAPYRSEFYLTPPQDPFALGGLRWADNLSVHEFRHVQQNSNFNHGFSKVFSVLFGEGGQALANALTVPDWFYEGDAVWNETAFSRQGRGRLPANYNDYKSLQLAGYHYSFMKLRNGSLKDFVPNHYDLGYLLVTYAREKYGDSIWKKVTQDAVDFKGVFYPWQKAVKRYTGLDYPQFTSAALNYFRQQWQQEEEGSVHWITAAEKNNVTSYTNPYPSGNGDIIVLKRSYRQIPVFIRRTPDGKEQRIAVKNISNEDYFSYRNGYIVYTALKPDARWGYRDYAVIRLLQVATRKTISIAAKGKYFSPDINEDASLIVAVNADPAKPCVLNLIDRKGTILKASTADASLFYSHPKFISDSTVLVAARQLNGNMGWLTWHVKDDSYTWLLPPAPQMIGFPVIKNDTVYYSGTAGRHDGLYAIPLSGKNEPVLIAGYPTGIYQGFADKGRVVGSVFTANGYRLGSFEAKSIFATTQQLEPLYAASSFSNKINVTAAGTTVYASKKYSKLHKLFNFHSWQPDISEPEYGVSLLGENVLSTMYSELFYTWNRNENSHKLGASVRYGGWYLQPFITAGETFNREVVLNSDTTFKYNETELTAGLQLPLNLSFGNAYRFITLSAAFTDDHVKWKGIAKDFLSNTSFNYITARLNYTVQMQKAAQQIYPHYAESFLAVYQRSVSRFTAWQYLLSGALYLPGLFNTHNIVLTAAYQQRDTMQQYIFSNSFPFSRGYSDVNFPRMLRLGFNYHLPLFYPDRGFGNMLYFTRIRMNAFYDYTRGESLRTGNIYPFSALGSEFFFDTKWWNQLPLTIGIRYSRLLNNEYRGITNPNQWEIILPVNLLAR